MDNATQRLNKRMAELGLCSRREADDWIAHGWVRVNGQPASMGMQVTAQDRITVERQAQQQQRQWQRQREEQQRQLRQTKQQQRSRCMCVCVCVFFIKRPVSPSRYLRIVPSLC